MAELIEDTVLPARGSWADGDMDMVPARK